MTLDELLAPDRIVDLTQPLGPATPLWPGSKPFSAELASDYEPDGSFLRDLAMPEHAGTHLDAPAHFVEGAALTHQIPPAMLVRPAVKLDVRPWVGDDASATIGRDVVEELERRDGEIQAGSAVLVHTGWDAHVGDPDRYLGDPLAFPGLGRDAAELLVERGVVGLGIDTTSVDPGSSTEHPVHHVTLPAGLWQLEGLVNLARVPPRGAWVVVGALLLVDGSGAPARVFAILPGPPGPVV